MNPKDEWDPNLQPIKRRQVSLKEKIQKWKKQRQSIFDDDSDMSESSDQNAKRIKLKLVHLLCDKSVKLPIDSTLISSQIDNLPNDTNINDILIKFSAQKFIELDSSINPEDSKTFLGALRISSVNYKSLESLRESLNEDLNKDENIRGGLNESEDEIKLERDDEEQAIKPNDELVEEKDLVECILSLQSAKEKENKKIAEEIKDLLSKPTAKEISLVEQFRSATGHVQEFCTHGTREECMRVKQVEEPCDKLHFLKIIQKHTDESLGDCSFLNTCFHMDSCKYVHYKVEVKDNRTNKPETSANYSSSCENTPKSSNSIPLVKTLASATEQPFKRVLFPSQWIHCDLRFFDMSVLGKFSVVMADPPWDIHMELPYGTMSDDEMRNLNIPCLQDEGLIFLWVTGRAMELGRECLKLWGYERCDELIWVKTNQLQRIIRTGRTGHWINHGKEHCLVGVKGNPKNLNRGLDCDVIVAEVRATSHKPDEIYGIIERLSPGTRKIELFGRQHNTQPNWVTLGNQLNGLKLVDPQLIETYKNRYPKEYSSSLNEESNPA